MREFTLLAPSAAEGSAVERADGTKGGIGQGDTDHCNVFLSQRSLRLRGEIFPMALRMRKYRASPLESTLTRKCVAKSFRIHSYKFKGLKLPWNDTVTKIPGGGASALLANTTLKPYFSQPSPNQLQIIGLKLNSRGTNTYKKCRAGGHFPLSTVDLRLIQQ